MNEQTYQIAFSGEILDGFARDQVEINLSRVFKIDAAKARRLFSGRKHILKKNLDLVAAKKYRIALQKLGANVSVVVIKARTIAASPAISLNKSQQASSSPASSKNIVQQRTAISAKTAVDCASKPVSMVSVAASANSKSSPLTPPAAKIKPSQPMGIILDGAQSGLASTRPVAKPLLNPLLKPIQKPIEKPAQSKESSTGRGSALEDLQRLLEKSRSKKSYEVTAKPTGIPRATEKTSKRNIHDNPLLKGIKLPTNIVPKPAESNIAKPSLTNFSPSSMSKGLAEKTQKKDPMLTNPILMGVKQKVDKSAFLKGKGDESRTKQVKVENVVTEVKQAVPEAAEFEGDLAVASNSSAYLQPEAIPAKVLESPVTKTEASQSEIEAHVAAPFEQSTLVSCIICGQTQHLAPHCLNCNSDFDAKTAEDKIHSEIQERLGHDNYENTPLEKVLWPGVTVLLFLYTLIFNFNLPLITFWVSDDTFDEVIAGELIQACHGREACLTAVNAQLDKCIKSSGIYEYKHEVENRGELDRFVDNISSCIVDVNGKAFFGAATDTSLKQTQ